MYLERVSVSVALLLMADMAFAITAFKKPVELPKLDKPSLPKTDEACGGK